MKQDIFIYFIGTAGSGKSTLSASMQQWCKDRGLDAIIVNLDPGAENLPYEPDVDIRDWISLREVMDANKLGPNGAQIACADMIALNTEDVKESINSFKADYIILDTPGQLELFVFREAGKYTVKFLSPEKSIIGYLLDPMLAKTASGFVSQLLLAITTNLRLNLPQINILTKADLLSTKEQQLINRWSSNPEEIYEALCGEEPTMHREMSEQILHLIKDIGGYSRLIPTSKQSFSGIEDIYTDIQQQFEGGEDLLKD
ncbi:MAG TPA: ATP/GTP-binding protein [Candidatus Thermoplasmatota archaeon]|nr:ATP/GTP-binding protein [Candidatus Thermoplasmatota archaeon]